MAARKTTAKPVSKTPVTPRAPRVQPKDYIRNLRGAEVRLRWPSQKIKDGDQSTTLTPRGYRGDIEKIPTKDDLNSKYYLDNLGLLFEALTADEAREVISKQSVNEQARVHPAQSTLRNELDQPYKEGAIQLEVPYEQQGKVVGTVDTEGKNVNINRSVGPHVTQVPGSQDIAALQQQDAIARQKNVEGPEAGGVLKVTVEDVKKT